MSRHQRAGATAATLIKHYSKRWTIEPQFRDTKDLRFGMGLSSTRWAAPASSIPPHRRPTASYVSIGLPSPALRAQSLRAMIAVPMLTRDSRLAPFLPDFPDNHHRWRPPDDWPSASVVVRVPRFRPVAQASASLVVLTFAEPRLHRCRQTDDAAKCCFIPPLPLKAS